MMRCGRRRAGRPRLLGTELARGHAPCGQRRSRRALHRAYASRADLLWVPLQLALLPPVLRHTAWALRDRSPVAVAEPASYALLATDAAEKVLAVTLRHRFRHLLPAVGWRPRDGRSAARSCGRDDAQGRNPVIGRQERAGVHERI